MYLAIYLAWIAWIYLISSNLSPDFTSWVDGWHRWDVEFYSRIFREGYGDDLMSLAFPPGYAWFTGFLSALTHLSFELIAMLLNLVAYFAASVIASELLSQRFGVSWLFVFIAQVTNPVAFFAFPAYSDALFALVFWSALALALRDPTTLRPRERIAAWLLVFIAPWIRLTGFALLIWAVFRRWFALAVLAPLVLLLVYDFIRTGDAFFFLHMQRYFQMPSGWFWDGLRYHAKDLLEPPPVHRGDMVLFWVQGTVFALFSTLLVAIASAWLAFRREFLLSATVLAVALFSRNQAYWRSVLRYDWPLMALLVLPWLVSSKLPARAPWRNRLLAYAARFFLFNLLFWGFLFQSGIARRMHEGLWAY